MLPYETNEPELQLKKDGQNPKDKKDTPKLEVHPNALPFQCMPKEEW